MHKKVLLVGETEHFWSRLSSDTTIEHGLEWKKAVTPVYVLHFALLPSWQDISHVINLAFDAVLIIRPDDFPTLQTWISVLTCWLPTHAVILMDENTDMAYYCQEHGYGYTINAPLSAIVERLGLLAR